MFVWNMSRGFQQMNISGISMPSVNSIVGVTKGPVLDRFDGNEFGFSIRLTTGD